MNISSKWLLLLSVLCMNAHSSTPPDSTRPRARDIGLTIGVLPIGPLNAITDVEGVEVGQVTVVEGNSVHTGVTAILPHGGNLFADKVPGAVYVGNGFGKLLGSTQVNELGEIETPIVLTSTLSAFRAADAILDYVLGFPGNEDVKSVNPLVAETNDGRLNDVRGRHISRANVLSAIQSAANGPVEEGSVGAGTGTIAFGFKGGIGTSSRRLPSILGGYTVGALVQSNFGGFLRIDGAPVGEELGRYYLKDVLGQLSNRAFGTEPASREPNTDTANGSIVIVIATDAPVDHRNLKRMAARAMMGLARTGSSGAEESGDYVIAFSVSKYLRIHAEARQHPSHAPSYDVSPIDRPLLSNDAMSPLFVAVIEATEEAIYNSLLRATSTNGPNQRVDALPVDKTVAILQRYGALKRQQ